MSIVITSKRKRKSNGNESITPDVADSGKKKRMETSKGDTSGKGEMNDVEIDISEEEHSKLLGLVTGQMKRLPLGEGVGEMEEDQVGLLKNKKKKRRLEKKREGSRDGVQKEAGGSVDKESASEYLNLWDTDRCNWSFKKKTQYWLLQNMYDKQQLSKLKFKIMLRYLEGLQGNQREQVLKKAKEIVEQNASSKEEVIEEKWKYKRAIKISQTLSN